MAAIVDALASYIQNMLKDTVIEEVHTLLGVSVEIGKMATNLGDLKNFLADADRRNIIDQSVQSWVRELRDAMYEASNILDLCQLKAMEQGPRCDVGCFNPLLFCMQHPLHAHNIGNRIKNLNQRLERIKKRSLNFGFIDLSSYEYQKTNVGSSHPISCETSAELDETSLVGEKIEEDMRNLVDMLTKEEVKNYEGKKITIFAIVGIGGIGKTTLAQKIFNHDTIRREFPKRIWLSVNQDFSETELLKKAITEARGDNHQSDGNTKGALERALIDALIGCKTLLVMDDVWNHQAWESVLKTPLVNVLGQGSCVLITTRHDMVARRMMAEEPYHHVSKLEPKDAWSLLKKQVAGNKTDEPNIEMLKDIGMMIVEKCDCLPLAVKVMGGLLRQKRPTQANWEKVLCDSIWSSQMPQELNTTIYLSYKDLHPCLKPCFLHYSLLPKGAVFHIDDIVGMWISEGFVNGTSHDLEDIGRDYYEELVQRNLIEPDEKYIDQVVCKMHDVVRSFAQYVARDEVLAAQNTEIDILGKLKSQKFTHLSMETKGSLSNQVEWSSLQAQISLRTLISVGNIKIKHGDSLISLSSLRTLHIQDANCDGLLESLDQLKHLRYLSIRSTNTSRLPESIVKLKFLQFIDLAGCKSLVKLPGGIGKLPQLRFLGLNRTSIKYIPRGFYGLTNLRKLYGFPAHMDGDWCSLDELGQLSQLTSLDIGGLENLSSYPFSIKSKLSGMVHLSYLFLDCTSRLGDDGQLVKGKEGILGQEQRQIEEVFDQLCPPPSLANLAIKGFFGQRPPKWMTLTEVMPLGSLKILMMDDLAYCTELPSGLCQLPSLELLRVKHAPAIKRVGPEFLYHNSSHLTALFPRLLKVKFIGMVEWEEWEWDIDVQAMPVLEMLQLEMCKLSHIPRGLAFHARNLKKLVIYDVKHLNSLENFSSIVDLEVFRNNDLERMSNLLKLQKLTIVRCPKMKILVDMPSLQRLELEDYDMGTLPGYLKNVNPKHFLLGCSLSLFTSIAVGKSSLEWEKIRHFHQVKAYAGNEDISMKWHLLYTRDPFRFEANINPSVIV